MRAFGQGSAEQVLRLRDDSKGTDVNTQLSVLPELVPLLQLSTIRSEQQRKAITDACSDSMQYFLNRVLLMARQQRSEPLKDWCNAMVAVFDELTSKPSPFQGQAGPRQPPTSQAQTQARAQADGTAKGQVKRDGNKWTVSGFASEQDLTLEGIDSPQTSVVICDCKKVVLRVPGAKLTAVSISSSTDIAVVIEGEVIGAVEVVNCKKAKVQIDTFTPTVTVDSSEAVTLYLSANCAGTAVFTSRAGEVNLVYPEGFKTGAEQVERAIPEQFKTVLVDSGAGIRTEPVQHAGA